MTSIQTIIDKYLKLFLTIILDCLREVYIVKPPSMPRTVLKVSGRWVMVETYFCVLSFYTFYFFSSLQWLDIIHFWHKPKMYIIQQDLRFYEWEILPGSVSKALIYSQREKSLIAGKYHVDTEKNRSLICADRK